MASSGEGGGSNTTKEIKEGVKWSVGTPCELPEISKDSIDLYGIWNVSLDGSRNPKLQTNLPVEKGVRTREDFLAINAYALQTGFVVSISMF